MKIRLLLLVAVVLGIAATNQTEPGAIPAKVQGVEVFLYSTPSREYDVIKSGQVVMMLDCSEIITKSIKQAAKEKADGVIIHFERSSFEAIKYR